MKRDKCGSSFIYSVEYKCTKEEIDVITTNMTQVKVSKRKPHSKMKLSVVIHGFNFKVYIVLFNAKVKNE